MKVLSRTDLSGMKCSATFSDDEAYRYHLKWAWNDNPPLVAWMLNPSTATHETLDQTIGGLVTRARAWGFGGVVVINLFGIRATDPQDMLRHPSPEGEHNSAVTRATLLAALNDGSPVIAAWGKHGRHRDREADALKLARQVEVPLMALELNQDGTPRHPLYIAREVRPMAWNPAP